MITLHHPLRVVNLGVETFADDLRAQGVETLSVDWRPSAGGDARLVECLDRLDDVMRLASGGTVAEANETCLRRIAQSTAVLVDVRPAGEVVPGLDDHTVYHAGAPLPWERMCGPMQGAIIGSILFEGWAKTPAEAEQLAAGGAIRFDSAHNHRALGPMSGPITRSMWVQVVRNTTYDLETCVTLHMGLGKVLRHGAYDDDVLRRLRWLNNEFAPLLRKAVLRSGGLDLKAIMAQALQMGDDGHNRNKAGNALFFQSIVPHLVAVGERDDALRAALFIDEAGHFILNAVMAGCKGMLDAGAGVPGSTVVTAMARNGVETAIRVSGAGNTWFTAPAPMIRGVYFPGFGPEDANPDMGDSAITETAGLGSMVMAGAPAMVQFIGGTAEFARQTSLNMYEITLAEHPVFKMPIFNFRGSPFGIDVRKVVRTGITPVINTGIACKRAGVGQIGAGVTEAPMECFVKAVQYLAAQQEEGRA